MLEAKANTASPLQIVMKPIFDYQIVRKAKQPIIAKADHGIANIDSHNQVFGRVNFQYGASVHSQTVSTSPSTAAGWLQGAKTAVNF